MTTQWVSALQCVTSPLTHCHHPVCECVSALLNNAHAQHRLHLRLRAKSGLSALALGEPVL
jgi:hypothetical protein